MPLQAMNPGRSDGAARYKRGVFFMALANLPRAVATFLDALGQRDIPAILARFAGDAVLVDRGVEHSGDTIRTWSESYVAQDLAIRPINAARRDGEMVLTAAIKRGGRATDGTAAQLDWWFTIVDGKISALIIKPAKLP